MMAAHVKAGALDGIAADDLEYPKAAAGRSRAARDVRARAAGAYDALASALLDGVGSAGQPLVAGRLRVSARRRSEGRRRRC